MRKGWKKRGRDHAALYRIHSDAGGSPLRGAHSRKKRESNLGGSWAGKVGGTRDGGGATATPQRAFIL